MGTRTYEKVHRQAVEAADRAAQTANPERFYVVQRTNPLDDTSPIKRQYTNGGLGFEAEGFGWVVLPGNTGFGRWLVRTGKGTKHYGGGVGPRARVRGYERATTWASTYAAVVNESGILPDGKRAYGQGRLD